MSRAWSPQALLREVALRLGPLRERVMFVGGAVTWLHITDPASGDLRATTDVDIVVEVRSRAAYYGLRSELLTLGFVEDATPGAPVCRWRHGELIVDVLPTLGEILGFSNRWYTAAFRRAVRHEIEGVGTIEVAAPTDFLAMKLEAFHDRGAGDYLMSKDIEDVIALIDGRPELVEEMSQADAEVRAYVTEEITALLGDPSFVDALYGHMPGGAEGQGRVPFLLDRLRALAGAPERVKSPAE